MEMTDEKLFQLCREYGEMALTFRRKFMGLLPEVYRRRLFEKKRFGSIFEFAAKLSGVSKKHVQRVLSLEERFKTMPTLHGMLVNGEVSINKLAKIASIATRENEEMLADQIKLLSCRALETLVRDYRHMSLWAEQNDSDGNLDQNGLFKAKMDQVGVHVNTDNDSFHCEERNDEAISNESIQASANFPKIESFGKLAPRDSSSPNFGNSAVTSLNPHVTMSLSKDELFLNTKVQQKLLELQNKGIDINQLLLEFLEKREEEIQQEKEEIADEQQENFIKYNITESRYIPAKTRKLLQKEHGTKCSILHCKKPWSEIHHTQRFSLTRQHNPRYMAPLCEEHHAIAHSVDVKFHVVRQARHEVQ